MTPNNPIEGDVCNECGISANVLTCLRKYKNRPNQLKATISTFHEGKCVCCGEIKQVTEQRDFFYPDFILLLRAKKGMALSKWYEKNK